MNLKPRENDVGKFLPQGCQWIRSILGLFSSFLILFTSVLYIRMLSDRHNFAGYPDPYLFQPNVS